MRIRDRYRRAWLLVELAEQRDECSYDWVAVVRSDAIFHRPVTQHEIVAAGAVATLLHERQNDFGMVLPQLSQTHAPTSTEELSAGPAALACSPPSLPRSLEEALHSLLPHERRRSSLQPALTDSCPLVCRRWGCTTWRLALRSCG